MKTETIISLSRDDAMCIERTIAIIKAIANARVCTSGGYITIEDLKYLAEIGKGHDPESKVDMKQINFMGWSNEGVTLVTERGDKK